MRSNKRFWIIFDADGDMYRSRRLHAPSRKLAIQLMKAIYGDGVRVRTIEMGTAYQLTYHVMPLAGSDEKAFLDAARERNGNLPVSLGRIPENRDTM